MALRKIGALWRGKEGSKAVLSGSIELLGEPIRIMVFKAEKKAGKGPDYTICRALEDEKPSGAQGPTTDDDTPL